MSVVWTTDNPPVSVMCAGDDEPTDDEVEEDDGVEGQGLPALRLTLSQERR